jgi:hypothetical protein
MERDHLPQGGQGERLLEDGIHGVLGAAKLGRMGGEHQDGLGGHQAFDGAGQFVAFHPRHVVIGDDEIKISWGEDETSFPAIGGLDHGVALEMQYDAEGVADGLLVVHHQDALARNGALFCDGHRVSFTRPRRAHNPGRCLKWPRGNTGRHWFRLLPRDKVFYAHACSR